MLELKNTARAIFLQMTQYYTQQFTKESIYNSATKIMSINSILLIINTDV